MARRLNTVRVNRPFDSVEEAENYLTVQYAHEVEKPRIVKFFKREVIFIEIEIPKKPATKKHK